MRTSHKLGQLNASQVLSAEGLIDSEQMREMLEEQKSTGERMTDIALARGLVTEYDIAKAMVVHLQIPYLHPKQYEVPDELVKPELGTFLRRNRILPLDRVGDTMVVASCGDITPGVLDELEAEVESRVSLFIATISELLEVLDEKYPKEEIGLEVVSRLDQLFGD